MRHPVQPHLRVGQPRLRRTEDLPRPRLRRPRRQRAGDKATAGDSTRRVGFQIGTGPITLTVDRVRRDQTPTGAQVVLNTYSFAATVPSISINGNPYIDTPWPAGWNTYVWSSISIPVPLDQVHDGPNTITFKSGDRSTTVANISIILVAASPVPYNEPSPHGRQRT